jgi:hypothetical protein
MKKILSIITLMLIVLQSQATHLMGGQITSQKDSSNLTHEVTLTLYRDTLGIPMPTVATITFTNNFGTFLFTSQAPVTSVTNIGNGVEKYEFTTLVTFPYYGTFKAYYNECCRNMAIINIPNAGNYSMYLDLQIEVDSTNSSPVFLNDPITLAQLNQPFSYNPSPFDVDGDSLSWVMDTPLELLSGVGSVIPGYSLPPSDTSSPFNLDQLTGEITFLPNTIGNFQISVKAIEWRNGVQIGFIRRDMQLIVIPSSNVPPLVTNTYNIIRTSSININPGQTLTFTMVSTDPDNQNIDVYPSGDIFQGNNVPTLTNTYISNSSVQSVLTWTPTSNEVRSRPYTFCLRLSEQFGNITFNHDYSFSVSVNSTTYIMDDIMNSKISLYPNPTVDFVSFELNNNQNGDVFVTTIDGKVVKKQRLVNGMNMINMSELSSGVYRIVSTDKSINKSVIKN